MFLRSLLVQAVVWLVKKKSKECKAETAYTDDCGSVCRGLEVSLCDSVVQDNCGTRNRSVDE